MTNLSLKNKIVFIWSEDRYIINYINQYNNIVLTILQVDIHKCHKLNK